MSRKVKEVFDCECGGDFEAWVYESVNVTIDPKLNELIFAGQLNVIECPHCGEKFDANIPFIYHDMDNRYWIWVYPEETKEFATEVEQQITELIDESGIADTMIENSAVSNYMIIYGVYELMQFLLTNNPDIDVSVQYKHYCNGITFYDKDELDKAISLWQKAIENESDKTIYIVPQSYFNIACAECSKGNMDSVLVALRSALKHGMNRKMIKTEPGLAAFRKDQRYKESKEKL